MIKETVLYLGVVVMISETAHYEILNKFELLKGTLLIGKNTITNLPPDDHVSEMHHLHSLQRGMYRPASQPYLLSIKVTDEEVNYGQQIEWLDNTKEQFIRINLAPPQKEKDVHKETDIAAARYNMANQIPLGIIYKVQKGEYKCLGLGLITEEDDNGIFKVTPFNENAVTNTITSDDTISALEVTEAISIVKRRVGQDKFREKLLKRNDSCQICGISAKHTIASHIKPWAVAENTERLDLDNGFLLCPNHDRLFDKGYITFDNKGHIMISPQLNEIDQNLFGVLGAETIELVGKQKDYLKYHRNNVFRK